MLASGIDCIGSHSMRQVQKSDRINLDRQFGSDQLGSNKKIKIK